MKSKKPKKPTARSQACIVYSDAGYTLFPLRHKDKIPIKGFSWSKEDISLDEVCEHVDKGGNYGIRLERGQLVIDVDFRNTPDGKDTIPRLSDMMGIDLWSCSHVKTGNGYHFYLKLPKGIRIRKTLKAFPGVDFLSKGCYVVGAGSIHPDGPVYTWKKSLQDGVTQAPKALLDAIEKNVSEPANDAEGGDHTPEDVAKMLSYLDVEEYQEYEDWLRVMMASHHASNGQAVEEFVEWSTGDPVYSDHDEIIRDKWASLSTKGNGSKPVTAATLYAELHKAGHGDKIPRNAAKDFEDVDLDEDEEDDDPDDTPPKPKAGLRVFDAVDFLKMDIPEPEPILAPVLFKQNMAMIFARPGIGKTHTSIEMSTALATGTVCFGIWTAHERQRVLFVDGEMPANQMQKRIREAVARCGKELEPGYFQVITPDLQPGFMPDLGTEEGQKLLKPYTDEADFIVIDNLSCLVRTGKENDADTWHVFLNWLIHLRSRGKSILVVHHAGKTGAQRGSSKKEDAMDIILRLDRPEDYVSDQGARFEVHFDKARHLVGDAAKPFEAQLMPSGWVIRPIGKQAAREAIVETLRKLRAQGKTWKQIQEETGVAQSSAHRWLQDARGDESDDFDDIDLDEEEEEDAEDED